MKARVMMISNELQGFCAALHVERHIESRLQGSKIRHSITRLLSNDFIGNGSRSRGREG